MDHQCVSLLVRSRVMFLEHRNLIPGPLEHLHPKDITQKFVLLFNLTIDRIYRQDLYQRTFEKRQYKRKTIALSSAAVRK